MNQQEIDQLLESSDSELDIDQKKKKNKPILKKQQAKPQKIHDSDSYVDDFFQSQVPEDSNRNSKKDKLTSKESKQSKKQATNINKASDKIKNQNTRKEQEHEVQQEQNYLDEEDFESAVSQGGDQGLQPQTKLSKAKCQQQEENYEMSQNFQEEQIAASKNESSVLDESKYTESRVQNQEIQEDPDNVDEDIQTVKSSKIRSRIMGDDQLSEAESEYIQSTRINQLQFKKKPESSSKQQTKNNQKPASSAKPIIYQKNLNMKKKKSEPEPINPKKNSFRKDTVPSKKQLPETKKPSEKNISQTKKKNDQQKNYQNKSKRSQEDVYQERQEHKLKLEAIENQRKQIEQKKINKLKLQKEKAKAEYEEMKQKEEERKKQNKRIMQEQKKKKQEKGLNGTIIKGDKKLLLEAQRNQLELTDSKVKQLAEEEAKKRNEKAKRQITAQLKEKRRKQQQEMKNKLETQNKQKMKKLQEQKIGYMDKTHKQKAELESKRKQIMKEKKDFQKQKKNEKINEKKQNQTPQVRKIKQQITLLKEKIKQKEESIGTLEDYIKELNSKMKNQEVKKFNIEENDDKRTAEGMDILGESEWLESDLSSVERFVRMFDQCETPGQIFGLLDEDRDQVITLEEIRTKVTEILLNQLNSMDRSQILQQQEINMRRTSLHQNERVQSLIEQIYQILDKNSDGNITKDQFSFIIDSEIKKAQQYRKLTNNISLKTPIDIEASILDMKEKIKYMQRKCRQELSDGKLQELEAKYQKYLIKHQEYEKKLMYGNSKKDKKIKKENKQNNKLQNDLNNDRLYYLNQEVQKLRLKKENESKMLEKIRAKQAQNIKQKNMQLTQKVQQNIKLSEEIYKTKQQIEQCQLRFLSQTKIQQNRYRYMAKKSQKNQAYEEAIQRAKEYQTKILNPTKQIKFGTYVNQVKYLAAVIMIQRNYRKRKAIREKERRASAR